MKHRSLGRACLLTVALSVGCAEGTRGPDPATLVDEGAGGGASRAGAGGNSFQPGAGTRAGGSANVGGMSGMGGATAGAPSGGAFSTGGVAEGGTQAKGGAGSPSNAGGAGATGVAGGSPGSAGAPAGQSCAPLTFSYSDQGHTLTSVAVSGSFDAWDTTGIALTYEASSQSWQVAMPLAAGSYQYKFVLDGSDWKSDPANSSSVGDGFGGVNSVVVCE